MSRVTQHNQESPDANRRARKAPRESLWGRVPFGVYVGLFAVLVIGLAIGVPRLVSRQHHDGPAGSSGKPSSLGVTDLGKPAPAFTLKDYKGDSVAVSPGDGRPKVLLFYMGYF